MGNGNGTCRKWLAQLGWVATIRGLADRDERNRYTGGVPRTAAIALDIDSVLRGEGGSCTLLMRPAEIVRSETAVGIQVR